MATALVIGLLVSVIVGIVCGGIGFWLGYRSAESGNAASKVGTPTPMPTPGTSPTQAPSPTPTPTPEISGKYTGPMGEVEISDVTEKTFSFSIGVGNENGSGSIDGEAVRTTPTTAVFSQKIPDESIYNDPESSYYKKKCKISFRFTGGRLKVSEDDYACSYWHGAQVDFNGTFALAKKK